MLAVSFLSLGWRTGIVVALSIPLVLAMTFLAMYLLGIDLQRISLGALIIALGLLVDDAIIAVEMMALKLEQGWDRVRAATFAYTATAFPMLTGTLITAAGFLPVGLRQVQRGRVHHLAVPGRGHRAGRCRGWSRCCSRPTWATSCCPSTRRSAGHDARRRYDQRGFYGRFRRCVECVPASPRPRCSAVTLALFVGALGLFQTVPQQFFPASSRPELMVDLWLPEAASFKATRARRCRRSRPGLRKDPDVEAVTSYIGNGSPRFYLPLDVQTAQHQLRPADGDDQGRARRASAC